MIFASTAKSFYALFLASIYLIIPFIRLSNSTNVPLGNIERQQQQQKEAINQRRKEKKNAYNIKQYNI